MKIIPRESGQGLTEYVLILVLVAVVVIAALMVLHPHVEYFETQGNKGILSTAPVIYDHGTPVYLPEGSYFSKHIMVDYNSCKEIDTGPYYLKVGTTYENPFIVTVEKNSSSNYQICNNLRGTSVQVIYAFYKLEK